MKLYQVTAPLGLLLMPGADIGLADNRLVARLGDALKPSGRKGRFKVAKPLTLKVGTEFSSTSDMPKSMLTELRDLAAEAAAEQAKRDAEAAEKAKRDAEAAKSGDATGQGGAGETAATLV